MSREVFIVSGCRTAIGNFQGQFEKISASTLGSVVIGEVLRRAKIETSDVEMVIMGQILTAGQGQNPARQAAVGAKISYDIPAFTINMLCGSGLKAVCLGCQAISNGDQTVVVAGGQENMTKAPHTTYVRGSKLGGLQLADSLLSDGLTDAFNNVHVGKTAEHLATKYEINREAQDQFALESQRKTNNAVEQGYFKEEIVAVVDQKTGKILDQDEFPKPGTSLESLAKLRPAFDPNGSVTAGNASGINDGAAALVLCNAEQVAAKNLKPLAKVVAFAEVGVDPMAMGLGPIPAVRKVLTKAGWTKDDVDLYELNEAFAVQSIIVVKTLELDESKVNITGGALALGHPIGASGARVLVTLLSNLQRLNKKKGVAALCIGGGMGIAIAVEMC